MMKDFKEHINDQINEGFISSLLSFLSTTFGIDRWMYSANTGLFSRNRYSGNSFFGNPWGNITDPMKRRRMEREWQKKQKAMEKERAAQRKAREEKLKQKGKNNTNDVVDSAYADLDTILGLIESEGSCKLYTPENKETTTLQWIKKNYKTDEYEFVPSAWFQKNSKKFSNKDEFVLITGLKEKNITYYTALDCVVQGGNVILPWDDEDGESSNDIGVIVNELIIPATYIAYKDNKGLEDYIKKLQSESQNEV